MLVSLDFSNNNVVKARPSLGHVEGVGHDHGREGQVAVVEPHQVAEGELGVADHRGADLDRLARAEQLHPDLLLVTLVL